MDYLLSLPLSFKTFFFQIKQGETFNIVNDKWNLKNKTGKRNPIKLEARNTQNALISLK